MHNMTLMHLSIACPMVPLGDGGDLTRVGVKCILNPHPGRDEIVQQPHPSTRGDHSADWRRSKCPTSPPYPTLWSNSPPWAKQSGEIPHGLRVPGRVARGGGGEGTPELAIDRGITLVLQVLQARTVHGEI